MWRPFRFDLSGQADLAVHRAEPCNRTEHLVSGGGVASDSPCLLGAELEGDEAIARSNELTKLSGVKKALLWPYVGLILLLRLVSLGRTPILSALPTHVVKDVPEIPFLIYCGFIFLSVVLSR